MQLQINLRRLLMPAETVPCRAVMAVMGNGSVSNYVLQHAALPVAVVRRDLTVQGDLPKRLLCVRAALIPADLPLLR